LQKECGYPIEVIKQNLNKKRYKEFYFRSFNYDEPVLQTIEIKPVICKINDIYFDSYAEAGRFLGVSRQAVQQSKKRNG